MMIQTENTYGRNVLQLEKLNALLTTEKFDVEDLTRINIEREKEIDVRQNEIKKCDALIVKKQQKVVSLNKKVEEVRST